MPPIVTPPDVGRDYQRNHRAHNDGGHKPSPSEHHHSTSAMKASFRPNPRKSVQTRAMAIVIASRTRARAGDIIFELLQHHQDLGVPNRHIKASAPTSRELGASPRIPTGNAIKAWPAATPAWSHDGANYAAPGHGLGLMALVRAQLILNGFCWKGGSVSSRRRRSISLGGTTR